MRKKGKNPERKSGPRDGQFIADLWAFKAYPVMRVLREGSVYRLSELSPCILKRLDEGVRPLPTLSTRSPDGKLKWKVAPWRETTQALKAKMFQHALGMIGPVQAFTLNLGDNTRKLAQDSAQSVPAYLRKRLTRELRAALGRPVAFWFAYETTHKGRPHLHGALGISPDELVAARHALRRAGGRWKGLGSQHQLKFKAVYFGEGWAQYAFKQVPFQVETKKQRRVYAASQPLIASAKDQYEVFRYLVDRQRRQPMRRGAALSPVKSEALNAANVIKGSANGISESVALQDQVSAPPVAASDHLLAPANPESIVGTVSSLDASARPSVAERRSSNGRGLVRKKARPHTYSYASQAGN